MAFCQSSNLKGWPAFSPCVNVQHSSMNWIAVLAAV